MIKRLPDKIPSQPLRLIFQKVNELIDAINEMQHFINRDKPKDQF